MDDARANLSEDLARGPQEACEGSGEESQVSRSVPDRECCDRQGVAGGFHAYRSCRNSWLGRGSESPEVTRSSRSPADRDAALILTGVSGEERELDPWNMTRERNCGVMCSGISEPTLLNRSGRGSTPRWRSSKTRGGTGPWNGSGACAWASRSHRGRPRDTHLATSNS